MQLTRITHARPDLRPYAPVAVLAVRDEMLRLPYLLAYYRSIGLEHFFVVDNDSSDGTFEWLRARPDVTLYHTPDPFSVGSMGMAWEMVILNEHCLDRWVMVVDADEMLIWPDSEREPIQELTTRLDHMHARVLFTLMVDMYSDRPFGSVGYVAGEPFAPYAPFFDRAGYTVLRRDGVMPYRELGGGARARRIRELPDWPERWRPVVSKVPLVYWQRGQTFSGGAHKIWGAWDAASLAPMRGALLHFKAFDDLPEKCAREVGRGEHFRGGFEYHLLGRVIERLPGGSFFDPAISVRYEGPAQLTALSLMDDHDPYGAGPAWAQAGE